MTKVCKICNVPKELSEFPKNATANDGHYHICKDCHNPVQAVRRNEHRKDVKDFYKMFL